MKGKCNRATVSTYQSKAGLIASFSCGVQKLLVCCYDGVSLTFRCEAYFTFMSDARLTCANGPDR